MSETKQVRNPHVGQKVRMIWTNCGNACSTTGEIVTVAAKSISVKLDHDIVFREHYRRSGTKVIVKRHPWATKSNGVVEFL